MPGSVTRWLLGNPARAEAVSEYAEGRGRFSGILGRIEPRVVHKRISGLEIPRYIVQTERGTRVEADAQCSRLQRAGGTCFVLANRGKRLRGVRPSKREISERLRSRVVWVP